MERPAGWEVTTEEQHALVAAIVRQLMADYRARLAAEDAARADDGGGAAGRERDEGGSEAPPAA